MTKNPHSTPVGARETMQIQKRMQAAYAQRGIMSLLPRRRQGVPGPTRVG